MFESKEMKKIRKMVRHALRQDLEINNKMLRDEVHSLIKLDINKHVEAEVAKFLDPEKLKAAIADQMRVQLHKRLEQAFQWEAERILRERVKKMAANVIVTMELPKQEG